MNIAVNPSSPSGATLASCLTLSSVLASCCWMSSSSSVSWVLFVSSALWKQKSTFGFVLPNQSWPCHHHNSCLIDVYSRNKRNKRRLHSLSTHVSLPSDSLLMCCSRSDCSALAINQSQGREGQHTNSKLHMCTKFCRWKVFIRTSLLGFILVHCLLTSTAPNYSLIIRRVWTWKRRGSILKPTTCQFFLLPWIRNVAFLMPCSHWATERAVNTNHLDTQFPPTTEIRYLGQGVTWGILSQIHRNMTHNFFKPVKQTDLKYLLVFILTH